jgi:hypothetical protein
LCTRHRAEEERQTFKNSMLAFLQGTDADPGRMPVQHT